MWRKGNSCALLVGMKIGAATKDNSMKFHQKIKNETNKQKRTGYGTMDWFKIGKGVCQGCILSLCLFNFYTDYIM